MALFNYTAQYSNINQYIVTPTNNVSSDDLLKIFISPDTGGGGHFITRGFDLTADFSNGRRGLVPANGAADLAKTFLRGDGWSALWSDANQIAAAGNGSAAQQAANVETYLQTTIVSAYDIKQWIAQSFVANDAMRFKGIIIIDGQGNITSTTNASGFPTVCEVGDTYKISGQTQGASSYIGGEYVSSGDMAICIKAGSGANLNDAQYWTIVQDNIEHLITYTFNGTAHYIYSQSPNNITIYAPTSAGTLGFVLTSNGTGEPSWSNPSLLIVGEANKVTHSLDAGNGIIFQQQSANVSSYDGSITTTIRISPATTAIIGGVIIDNGTNSAKYNNIANTNNTPYPTITVDSSGQIYLTHDNIVNALGYDPISALPIFTDQSDGIVPMSSLANKQTNNVDNVLTNQMFVLGEDAKWYKLPESAFIGTWRSIKVNNIEILDNDPTNNLSLNLIAGDKISLVPLETNNVYNGGVQVVGSWRDIFVHKASNGAMTPSVVSIGDNNPLEFENSESIFMLGEDSATANGTKTTIKSYLTWYNIDTQEYELV